MVIHTLISHTKFIYVFESYIRTLCTTPAQTTETDFFSNVPYKIGPFLRSSDFHTLDLHSWPDAKA